MSRARSLKFVAGRRLLSAIALGACVAVTSGCSSFATLAPYTPAAGVQTNQDGIKVRNLLLVPDGDQARMVGTLIASEDDSVTNLTAQPLKPDNEPSGSASTSSPDLQLPAGEAVSLSDSGATVTGDFVPGLLVELTMNFEKSGDVTLLVPVMSPDDPDFQNLPSAQSS